MRAIAAQRGPMMVVKKKPPSPVGQMPEPGVWPAGGRLVTSPVCWKLRRLVVRRSMRPMKVSKKLTSRWSPSPLASAPHSAIEVAAAAVAPTW